MKTLIYSGVCVAVLGLAVSSRSATFDLTFTDYNSVVQGYGVVTGSANGDGSFNLTSGSWDVVAGSEAGVTGTILPNLSSPSTVLSPSGFFAYDSQLSPTASEIVDYWGLLFHTAGSPSEINLFSDSPTQYEEYFNDGTDIFGTLSVQEVVSSDRQIPAPDTASTGLLLGATVFGFAGLRRFARK